jgi:hypothetical protein
MLCAVLRTDWRRANLHAALGHDAMGVGSEFKWIVTCYFFSVRVHRNTELEMLTIWLYPIALPPPSEAFLFTMA